MILPTDNISTMDKLFRIFDKEKNIYLDEYPQEEWGRIFENGYFRKFDYVLSDTGDIGIICGRNNNFMDFAHIGDRFILEFQNINHSIK